MTLPLIVGIDCQVDFMLPEGALPVPGSDVLVEPMERYLEALDPQAVRGVLLTLDSHDPATYGDSAEARQFPPHCLKGTPGHALAIDKNRIPAALPVYTLEKGVFDMWEETGLQIETPEGMREREAFFARLKAENVDTVDVFGVALNFCVRQAINGFIARGFKVRLLGELTRGIPLSPETTEKDTQPQSHFRQEIDQGQVVVL